MTQKNHFIIMPDLSNCGFADPQALLGMALEARNIREFKVALHMGANPNRADEENMSVFEKALQTYGCAEFVKECLKYGCSPSNINRQSNKSALSYATDSRDPRILESLLHQQNTQLNATYAHLTPLNSLAKNLTTENIDDVIACIELLLDHGASPNIPDQREMTPIQYVIKNKQLPIERKHQLLQKFLNHPEIDLDTFRDGEARLRLKNEFPDLVLPLATSNEVDLNSLLILLRHRNEAKFLDSFSNYQLNISEKDNMLNTVQEQNLQLLMEATKGGLHKAFDVILRTIPNINLLYNNNSAIKIACIWGNWVALEKLLDRNDLKLRVQDNLLITVIKKLEQDSLSDFCDYKKCLFILFDSGKINVNEADASRSTALHYAIKHRNKMAIQELLKRGAYIGSKSQFNDIPIDEMDPDILEEYFDSCITTNGYKASDEGFEIIINYSNLIPNQPVQGKSPQFSLLDEMAPITRIAEVKEMRHLLKHPLITSFLFLKWHRLSIIFYINLIIYSLFCLSIVIQTVLKFRESDNRTAIAFFGLLSFIGIGYLILRELVQVLISPIGYLQSPMNYLEVLLIGLCVATVTEQSYDQQTQKHIAVLTMLLLSVELCHLVGSLPVLSISTHMLMLRAVLKSFMKSFALYSIFVITFSLCFYILFGKEEEPQGDAASGEGNFNKFSNPFITVIKTIVMLTGEFDAGDLEFNSVFSYWLFLLFVIFMSIVLFNLLNGLAVNDTHEIKAQAELNGSICRVNLLTAYEHLLTGQNHRTNVIVNYQPFLSICRRLINLFPHYIVGTHISVLPNDRNKVLIPIANLMEMTDLQENNSQKTFLPLRDYSDNEKRFLDPPVKCLPCCCNCITGRCSEMDSRTVKMAIAVIERKNAIIQEKNIQDFQEIRLKNIEDKVEKMFEMLRTMSS